MNVNVEAVYIVSAMIFVTCMGGLAGIWALVRHDDRIFKAKMERHRADRG